MGDSFEAIMMKSKAKLERKIDRAAQKTKDADDGEYSQEALEALIRCEELNQQSNALETGTDESDENEETEVEEAQSANQRKSSLASNDGDDKVGWWQSHGNKIAKAIKDVNFDVGLEVASPEAIRSHIE